MFGGVIFRMVKEDFKLKLYFNMYKDYPIGSRDSFRGMFTKKHGRFNYLPELIYEIEIYQIKKYGSTLWSYVGYEPSKKKKGKR